MEYLSYRTSTKVSVHVPDSFRPPALSLCVPLWEIFNVNALDESDRQRVSKIWDYHKINEEVTKTISKYSMKFFMENLTYSARDLESSLHAVEYYKHDFKCTKYSKFENADIKIEIGDVDKVSSFMNEMMSVSLNHKFKNHNVSFIEAALFFHDSRHLAHLRSGNILWMIGEEGNNNFHIVTYDQFETKNLPSPFFTHCVPYEGSKFSCYGDCFEHCYEKKYHLTHGINYGLITSASYQNITIKAKPNMIYDREIDLWCKAKCHTPCEAVFHYSVSIGSYHISSKSDIWMHFQLTVSRPFTKVTLIESFDLNSYIIFMASAAGLWLGCSLFVTVGDIINFLFNVTKNLYK